MAIKFSTDHQPERNKKANESNSDLYGEGTNGSLIVNEYSITIMRKGFTTKLIGLRGNKEILISDITSIQFKEPGLLTNGFIQFSFAGSNERNGGTFNAVSDENSVTFTKKNAKKFQYLKEVIDRKRIASKNNSSSTSTSSLPDTYGDLEKLAQLKDKGIITQEEFDVKKKQILNL